MIRDGKTFRAGRLGETVTSVKSRGKSFTGWRLVPRDSLIGAGQAGSLVMKVPKFPSMMGRGMSGMNSLPIQTAPSANTAAE
jgi:hypothetical protein